MLGRDATHERTPPPPSTLVIPSGGRRVGLARTAVSDPPQTPWLVRLVGAENMREMRRRMGQRTARGGRERERDEEDGGRVPLWA